MNKILAVIPARYASTRFPGKPLALIAGKSMIQRVYEQCSKASSLSEVVVATDDERISDHVKTFGGRVVMTSPELQSGTDRCAETYRTLHSSATTVLNIQGDEPFIDPAQIDLLASCFAEPGVEIASLVKVINGTDELMSPNTVKAVRDIEGHALYFSRQPIPFGRNREPEHWLKHHTYYKHIGIYGFNSIVLEEISQLPVSALETAESLEQLRWLENGYRIWLAVTDKESMAVDTPADLQLVEKYLAQSL
jgi:3-deoxy-manno-octulosonate cytidylyltransferase (CMP-KDO synthetase)